ncbi:chemotaxis protein CheD [Desulfobacter postgatei]|jgi:chemotaxis protein CheD|uniref:chemotaxis protein CheD n=1 Tax=Desulfobacter postgatei TaxID=2293 RepID=UPI002A366AA7|nr:chemotaxis protein CheD [Desulfobacter postgatei]MDX9964162.1 chemotaxis protein CheD [Desulfobacter postgatei]
MEHIVGIADMKVSNRTGDTIVTYSLGSCVGLAIYDPQAGVGGILHYILPNSAIDEIKAKSNPFMFADTGIPELFKQVYALGAEKSRIKVFVAGGAEIMEQEGIFNIGRQNYSALMQILTQNNLSIWKQAVGGYSNRAIKMEIASGKIYLKTSGLGEVQL